MTDKVAVGRFGSPYGVKGWLKVISYTDPIDQILNYLPWLIIKGNHTLSLEKVKGKIHGKNLVVNLEGCVDREQAKTFTNIEIYINRSQLPLLQDEYYWIDLVGLAVINEQQINLGKVDSLLATGSNDVLIVKDDDGKERYVPYLAHVVLKVDLIAKTMLVDWDANF